MRDTLPLKPYINEFGVVNLESSRSKGSHWVAYKKKRKIVNYFDSFGSLSPPKELQKYLSGCEIRYNYMRYQDFNSVNCGHLCLEFLLSEKT